MSSNNAQDQDRIAKKAILIRTTKELSQSTTNPTLQKFHQAVSSGLTIDAKILSGGYTNYSYKLYVVEQPEICAYAKLCFEYALWNPNKTKYDLMRTQNEYDAVNLMSKIAPDTVVQPICCVDIDEGQKMKLYMTEWSRSDEQMVNQFIEGSVDERIAPKIASALAALHNFKDFDPGFNSTVKPQLLDLYNQMDSSAKEIFASAPKDRTTKYYHQLGKDKSMALIERSIDNYKNDADCLIHADAHLMNILVESKPNPDDLTSFGPNGTITLCDFEMSIAGPIGEDLGVTLCVPISLALAHAINGNDDANVSIIKFIDQLLGTYIAEMKAGGKNDEEMSYIVRNIIARCGMRGYLIHYMLDMIPQLPMPELSGQNIRHLADANGILGLEMMRFGFDDDYIESSATVDELIAKFNELLKEEMKRMSAIFASSGARASRRRSSILRATGRRISDAALFHEAIDEARRLSALNVSGTVAEEDFEED